MSEAATTEERRAKLVLAWPNMAEFIADLPAPEAITETCSRCRGTGTHSYHSTHGTVCFKCSGSRRQIIGKQAKKYKELFKPKRTLDQVRAAGDTFMHALPYAAFEVVWATQGGARVRIRALNLVTWGGMKRYLRLAAACTAPAAPGHTSGTVYETLPTLPAEWLGTAVQPEHLEWLLANTTYTCQHAPGTAVRVAWLIEN